MTPSCGRPLAVRLARALGNPTATAWALYAFGESLMEADPTRAETLLDEAVLTSASVGNEFITGVALVSATSLRGRLAEPANALAGYHDLIVRWQRSGNWPQQWVTLRNLLELLARLGHHECAAVLYGAVTASPSPPPENGPEAERLARAMALIECALGAPPTSDAIARGCSMTKDDAVAYARNEIGRLLATVTPVREAPSDAIHPSRR